MDRCRFRAVVTLIAERAWVIALTVGFAFGCQPIPGYAQPLLELELVRSVPVPGGFVVRGGALVSDSTFVAWGPAAVLLARAGSGPRVATVPGTHPVQGLRVLRSGRFRLEMVGGGCVSGRIDELADRLTCLVPPSIPNGVVQAVPLADAWLFLENNTDGGPPGLQLWTGGGETRRIEWKEVQADTEVALSGQAEAVQLSGGARGAFIAELRAPFRTWHLDPRLEGTHLALAPWSLEVLEVAQSHGFPVHGTVALPVLELDRGHLLVQLSDLTSDRRLVILVDGRGGIVRATVLDVAVGFMASSPPDRLILALRDTGVREFVMYRWRWSGGDHPQKEEKLP